MAATRTSTKKTAKTAKTAKKAVKRTAAKTVKRVSKSAAAKRTKKSASRTTRAAQKQATRAPATKSAGRATGDAIAVLKQDHREVEQLFKRFERSGSGAVRAKAQLVAGMSEALSRHAGIEELVFYPAVRRDMPRSESDVLEALEEHHVVKVVLRELEGLDPRSPRFDAKVTVMMELVRRHVKEEEGTLFPKVRDRIDRRELRELGAQLMAAKSGAPTRPHPAAPDEPPANFVAGAAVAVIDRARSVGKRAVDRVRDEIPAL
jgi:hemerythrin-like domain-containing protein